MVMEDRLSFLDDYDAVCRAMPVPDVIRSEYEVVSCLKPGADRQVFLLRNRHNGMRFVLKLAQISQLDRFTREYEALLRLHDGAFPHPVACFRNGGQACFLREYVPGRSLAECVEDDDPFSEDQARFIWWIWTASRSYARKKAWIRW
jgi:aminoglycoside phosphotransferase (APT) family kinase protein